MAPLDLPNPRSIDLRHVDHWLFDLDDTLYPAETDLMELIRERIAQFVVKVTGLPWEEARTLQRGWLLQHGATLPGVLVDYDCDAAEFLDYVHDVPLDRVPQDPELDAILARLPGRKYVFTNGSAAHAERMLAHIGIADRFEGVFHLEMADLVPKPHPQTYGRMLDHFAIAPEASVFFEDTEKNLEHAAELGMTTVLVGPHAEASTAPHVHYRTHHLTPFLRAAAVKEIRA
jgi:putative hydrolase of the HAD superfamily